MTRRPAGITLGPADPIDEWDDDPGDGPPPPPDDDGTRLTLAEYVRLQAERYEAAGTDAASLVAEALRDLLSEIVVCGYPDSADQLRDRRVALGFRVADPVDVA